MKMENPVRAPHAGQVTDLRVGAGETVAQGTALCRVRQAPEGELTERNGDPGRGR
jgi:pyruvate/2-oxoglutarate dehydrogenase complex dihydrolipoamide acyltransferase (E2) component